LNYMLHPENDEPNLLKILKNNGYYVWWGGKNDLVPGQHGFDLHCDKKFIPSPEDAKRWGHTPQPDLHNQTKWRGEPGSSTYYGFYAGKLDTGQDDIYFDRDWAMVMGAIDFISQYDGDKPLCIFLPLSNPHPPYGVEEPWFSRIDRSQLPTRTPSPPKWKGKPSLLKGIWERQNLQSWPEEQWAELRATYYGMCARLDHQMGMLIEALKKANYYDETALFLFSDHGDFTGDYGLVEKTQNTFEDCLTRVPLIIKPPKLLPLKPGINEVLTELVDFSATVYELTGIDPKYPHFGKSLLPIIAGTTDTHRDAVFCEGGRLTGEKQAMELSSFNKVVPPTKSLYWPRVVLQHSDEKPWQSKAAMCRTKHHKYVRRHYEQDELYDLQNDPQEIHNVIDNPSYSKILSSLKERLLAWYMETCDVVPFEEDKR